MTTLNLALVGFGISAKVFHAPFLVNTEGYKLTAILERNKEESKALYPDARIVRSMEELLSTDVDVVVITTPNNTHFPYAEMCLKAGKHVVVEKPFTIKSSEARSLISLAETNGKVLSVYHNRRYVSDYMTIRQIIKNGLLGEVHDFEAHYDRYRPEQRPNAWKEAPEEGSGILYDLGSHLFDQALQLFGKPKEITATVKMQRPHALAVDYFDVRMDYGFLTVTLKAGMLVREQGPRYLIHGTLGSFIKYGEDIQEAALRAGKTPIGKDWGKEPDAFHGLIHTQKENEIVRVKMPSRQGNFGLYYEELRDCLINGKPNPVTPEQAHDVIRCIEIAMESSQKKQTIVCDGFIS